MNNRVVGMTRLSEYQASFAVMAMMEEIRGLMEIRGEDPKSEIVFTGRINREGIKVPSMIVIDLYKCHIYVSVGADLLNGLRLAPKSVVKRARRLAELLLRQYLKQHGRSTPIAQPRAVPQQLTIYHGTIQA